MGLLRPHLHLLARQSKTHPIHGKVLVLGQQAVFATPSEVKKIYKQAGATIHDLPDGFDTTTKIPEWKNSWFGDYTNCQTVLRLLGAESVDVADISNYEDADIIMDLSKPCDKRYHNQYDVVLDVGTLEHVFNLPQALENIHRVTRPGGTIILINPATNSINHGFYQMCPTLYYDYFGTNGWEKFSCYLVQLALLNLEKKHKVYRILDEYIGSDVVMKSRRSIDTALFARKKTDAIPDAPIIMPIQGHYQTIFNGTEEKKQRGKIKNLISYMFFLSRRWRPGIVDQLKQSLLVKKRIEYIGKY